MEITNSQITYRLFTELHSESPSFWEFQEAYVLALYRDDCILERMFASEIYKKYKDYDKELCSDTGVPYFHIRLSKWNDIMDRPVIKAYVCESLGEAFGVANAIVDSYLKPVEDELESRKAGYIDRFDTLNRLFARLKSIVFSCPIPVELYNSIHWSNLEKRVQDANEDELNEKLIEATKVVSDIKDKLKTLRIK
jgi:hypothetical protein